MLTKFQCRCGKWLRARAELAGKQVRCPGCARMLVVPQPAPVAARADWQIDVSPAAAQLAQTAGVVSRGRASVVRLHAEEALARDLPVNGEVTCGSCRTIIAFRGPVFGRPGLGGTLANVTCPACKASIWIGYASHVSDGGTDIFIYIPSLTRDFDIDEGGRALPAPALTVRQPPALDSAAAVADPGADGLIKELRKAVAEKQTYAEVRNRAAALVTQRLATDQLDRSRAVLRKSLAKEDRTYLMAILTEALACLRDEEAGPVVQAALRRALDAEDVTDRTNAPLQELCVLSLLFGDASGFKAALERGFRRAAVPTRACKLGKQLLLTEVIELLKEGEQIDSYDSVFGGDQRLFVYVVRPQSTAGPETEQRPGLLSRLFGQRRKPDAGRSGQNQ
jgi:hypothetical protein